MTECALLGTLLAGALLGAAGVSADPGTGAAVAPSAVNLLYFPPDTALDVYVASTGDMGEMAAGDIALLGTASVAGRGTLIVRAVPAGSPATAPLAWWTGAAEA